MHDLNDMIYFAEVIERGGFAAAGRALGVPKSRLSRRVAALEAQLGVRLLQRTTRQLSLTEVGEAYLRHCQALRETAQAAADTVAQVQTEPRGTVRVTCPTTLAQTVLAYLMPPFLARYPQVRVEMQVSNRQLVDIAVVFLDKRTAGRVAVSATAGHRRVGRVFESATAAADFVTGYFSRDGII